MLVYDSLEQARMRLNGSVITYREKAVVVETCNQRTGQPIQLTVALYPRDVRDPPPQLDNNGDIVNSNRLTLAIDDPELNFRVFHLGYLNDRRTKNAMYISRASRRQQSQGLVIGHLNGMDQLDHMAGHSQEFEDMLFGRYPTVEEALKRINEDDWTCVGISQHFALQRDPDMRMIRSLMYRGRRVGVALGAKFTEFLVDERDAYLAEVLQEANFPFRVE